MAEQPCLSYLVETSNFPELMRRVESGTPIDQQSPDGMDTALHIACHKSLMNAIEWLLEHGADPNKINSTGSTPLHKMASSPVFRDPDLYKRNVRMLEMILSKGAQPTIMNNAGLTPLRICPPGPLHKQMLDVCKSTTITVPQTILPRLIGSAGKNKLKFERDHGVVVELPAGRQGGEATVEITIYAATDEAAARAREVIAADSEATAKADAQRAEYMRRRAQDDTELELDVPRERFRFIIGRQGATLRALREKYDVVVDVPRQDAPPDAKIKIRGKLQGVGDAAEEIMRLASPPERSQATGFFQREQRPRSTSPRSTSPQARTASPSSTSPQPTDGAAAAPAAAPVEGGAPTSTSPEGQRRISIVRSSEGRGPYVPRGGDRRRPHGEQQQRKPKQPQQQQQQQSKKEEATEDANGRKVVYHRMPKNDIQKIFEFKLPEHERPPRREHREGEDDFRRDGRGPRVERQKKAEGEEAGKAKETAEKPEGAEKKEEGAAAATSPQPTSPAASASPASPEEEKKESEAATPPEASPEPEAAEDEGEQKEEEPEKADEEEPAPEEKEEEPQAADEEEAAPEEQEPEQEQDDEKSAFDKKLSLEEQNDAMKKEIARLRALLSKK